MHKLIVDVHLNVGSTHDCLEVKPHVGWELVVNHWFSLLAVTGDVQFFVVPREVSPGLGNQAK